MTGDDAGVFSKVIAIGDAAGDVTNMDTSRQLRGVGYGARIVVVEGCLPFRWYDTETKTPTGGEGAGWVLRVEWVEMAYKEI